MDESAMTMNGASALQVLSTPVPVPTNTCPVCGTPLGWWAAELVATHGCYHQAQAVVAAAVLT